MPHADAFSICFTNIEGYAINPSDAKRAFHSEFCHYR